MPVKVVDNAVEALDTVKRFRMEGYTQDNVYIIAHNDERTHHIAEAARANEVGITEEGPIRGMVSMFKSKGDELRSKMESIGLTKSEAHRYEEELDRGKIVVIAQ